MSDIECCECDVPFDEEDIIFKCKECLQFVCDNCKEKHLCVCEFDGIEQYCCNDCGNIEEEMHQCNNCNNYYCDNCSEAHKKREQEDVELEELTYAEAVEGKVVEKL